MAKKSIPTKSSAVTTIHSAKAARAGKRIASPPATETKCRATSSKSDQVLILLKRAGGATLDDLISATNWQAHSVRGFLSGTVRKRMGLTLVSELSDQGLRRYRITGEVGA